MSRNAHGLRLSTIVVATICGSVPLASSAPDVPKETDWLAGLQGDVRADIAAGRPIVVEVHVPLCDNAFITCGGRGRGDGDDLQRNLYWATSEGLVGWMNRRGSGWSQISKVDDAATGAPDILEQRVWRREVAVPRAWADARMPARFTVYLVGFAWRGRAIDRALAAFFTDLYGDEPRLVSAGSGAPLNAGGAARIVGWVGHNRLMDVPANWNQIAKTHGERRKGTLAVACYSAEYFRPALAAPTRVPLLMTTSFVMASSAAFEGGVMAFLAAGNLGAIRVAGATGYATGQGRPVERVRSGFINPSDHRW